MGYVEICRVNGVDLFYRRTGGDKPPLVLLHGLMTSGACLIPLVRQLEAEYDVIIPDMRGHGQSSSPKQGYDYDTLSTDVSCFIEVLHLQKPILVGHSMGGMTAALMAARKPNSFFGLVLIDPPFLTTTQLHKGVLESDVVIQHQQILNRSLEDVLAERLKMNKSRSPEILKYLVEARFQTCIEALEILSLPSPNYFEVINMLQIPGLLVIGGKGSVISLEEAVRLARMNTFLQVAQIAHVGHGIPFDDPEALAGHIQDFIFSLDIRKN